MEIPPDLDEAFRAFIPPFGAAGNPIDITGGEPPSTYEATIRLGLEDPRIHALVLGYWHTIVHPADGLRRTHGPGRGRGPGARASRSRWWRRSRVTWRWRRRAQYLFERGVVAYPYTTEKPVAVLGAKYRWARAAGCWTAIVT